MQKIKRESGITIIALVTTLSILMIIFGVTIYNTKKSLAIKDLTNLYSDVEMLEDRAKVYYAENGEFPVTGSTLSIEEHEVYQIDSNKINNINGLHYSIDDYYIDKTTGRVFLNDGVKYENITYHTKTQEEYSVEALEITQNIVYTITYSGLEGTDFAETNPNPTNYTKETDDIVLQNPTKDGYKFLGWVGTGLTEASKTVTIEKGSTDNREYTATWDEIIKYPSGKTGATVAVGDIITIENEEFTVINVSSIRIITIPKFNITLSSNPVQSETAGTIQFCSATDKNWNAAGNINMTEKKTNGDYKNNIQSYIDAYGIKLRNLGASNIVTRAVNITDIQNITNQQKNPGGTGIYWTSYAYSSDRILAVHANGAGGSVTYSQTYVGIRPAVIITL